MSLTVLIVTVACALPALVLGTRRVYVPLRWDQRRRRVSAGEAVDRYLIMALRFGLLVVLTLAAVIALVGSVAALYADVRLPRGVVAAGAVAVLLSLLTVTTFGRPRR